ncbi:hypothetical protein Tco_0381695 [Tanacetum coccineum]
MAGIWVFIQEFRFPKAMVPWGSELTLLERGLYSSILRGGIMALSFDHESGWINLRDPVRDSTCDPESPYLPVLFIGTSQSRQYDKIELAIPRGDLLHYTSGLSTAVDPIWLGGIFGNMYLNLSILITR